MASLKTEYIVSFILIFVVVFSIQVSSFDSSIRKEEFARMENRQLQLVYAAAMLASSKYEFFDTREYTASDDMFSQEFSTKRNYREAPSRSFVASFPTPPISPMEEEVEEACKYGVWACVENIVKIIRRTDFYKSELEHGWPEKGTTNYQEHDTEESILFEKRDHAMLPFQSLDKEFRFKITARYYMCHYTMNKAKALEHFSTDCYMMNIYNGSISGEREHRLNYFIPDYRGNNREPWGCAFISFCPDPCCGNVNYGTIHSMDACKNHANNPCQGIGDNSCSFNFDDNKSFRALVRNKLNYTCTCNEAGHRYDLLYRTCIDIDECREGLYRCLENTVCQNTIGSYKCRCTRGYFKRSRRCRVAKESPLRTLQDSLDMHLRYQTGR